MYIYRFVPKDAELDPNVSGFADKIVSLLIDNAVHNFVVRNMDVLPIDEKTEVFHMIVEDVIANLNMAWIDGVSHYPNGEKAGKYITEPRVRVRLHDLKEEIIDSLLISLSEFWEAYVDSAEDKRSVRVNHQHYWICNENDDSMFRGYAGAQFIIKFNDARIVRSTNLWCQGDIPPAYWAELPDNAKFIKEEEISPFHEEAKAVLESEDN